MTRVVPLFALAAMLAGCAGEPGGHPSLLPRPIEARGWAEPAARAPAPVAADPMLDAELARDRAALKASETAFAAGSGRAAKLVMAARGDAAGGERWIAAQTALADLDAQRAATSDTAGAIEQRALDRAATGQPDYPALEAASTAAQAQLDAETRRIGELQGALPQG